jgi:hypothetical protein
MPGIARLQGNEYMSILEGLKKLFAKIKVMLNLKNINIGNNSGIIGDNNEQHKHGK